MTTMERFINRLNIERYRKLVLETTDEAQRQQILKLLAEEFEIACRGKSKERDGREGPAVAPGLELPIAPVRRTNF
jgi:hypothetical protein